LRAGSTNLEGSIDGEKEAPSRAAQLEGNLHTRPGVWHYEDTPILTAPRAPYIRGEFGKAERMIQLGGDEVCSMGSRLSWLQIRGSREFAGRWVALDSCRYDEKTARPVEGTVVDSDEDLVALCNRIKEGDNRHCAIVFCDEADSEPPPSVRRQHDSLRVPAVAPGRQYTH